MSPFHIAIRSLFYFWRTNFAVALGVAAATAVLTGALIVGDSMRTSLRELTIERLGKIDEILVGESFFREKLADELQQTEAYKAEYSAAIPSIFFPGGTVESELGGLGVRRANRVAVLGVTDQFWELGDESIRPAKQPGDAAIIINQALADELRITSAQVANGPVKITLRIPKQNQLPGDSVMSKQDDMIESLVDLEIAEVIPTRSLGRFGLHPTQADPLNVYVPIHLLQNSLARTVLKHKSDPAQANAVLLSGKNKTPPSEEARRQLRKKIRPALADYGLSLKRVTRRFPANDADSNDNIVFDYWSLSADRMILTDEAAAVIQTAFPTAKPVFTYLANDIRRTSEKQGIPFSMVASIDFDDSFQPTSKTGNEPISELKDDEIVLNEWAANDIEAKVGDTIVVTYFQPETTHGSQVENTIELRLADVAKLAQPIDGYIVPRRGPVQVSKFDQKPEITNDPDLTPEVPGVTDAQAIDNWELPFATADRIRSEDDQYWTDHRTTPKAFVSLATGQRLWRSRFGSVTSFRIPVSAGDASAIEDRLLDQIADSDSDFGLQIVPIKRRGLAASSGSTPFDVLFLALSMFVIGSALILVSLLFRLGFQQRAAEVGLLSATGFSSSKIRRLWLAEMSLVSLCGSILGIVLGVGYAAVMIWGLSTWWVGAISRPFLHLYLSPMTLFIGLVSGLLVCVATIAWSLRGAGRLNVRILLAGQIESPATSFNPSRNSRPWLVGVLFAGAIGLTVLAAKMSGEAQAGSFLGAGFLVLAALLLLVYRWLRQPNTSDRADSLSLISLAATNARRNPLRSTLTIGLVAVAAFLIAAVSAFRLAPTEQGTAGFDWIAQSSQPILMDLSSHDRLQKLAGNEAKISPETVVLPLRYKSGEDASCNNLYQSTQPQVMGVTPAFINYFSDLRKPTDYFAWAGSSASTPVESASPWQLLAGTTTHAGTESNPIPVVIDKNTANYSLKIYMLDTVFKVQYDSGETIHFRTVGFLSNTILQGSLIVSENDFEHAFPSLGGYQYFLIREGSRTAGHDGTAGMLEDRLSDYGFDARSAPQILANFMTVQNTYLSTFQTLGALGLLLGTFGLVAVQLRSIYERQQELGLLRAVGFSQSRLSTLVLLENGFLLVTGLMIGIGAALFTTLPHWLIGTASVPWGELALMFGVIAIVGILASALASRQIFKLRLLDSLRGA